MKRLPDASTEELIHELRIRSGIRDMEIDGKEMYRIQAMKSNGDNNRFINVDEPTIILIAPKK